MKNKFNIPDLYQKAFGIVGVKFPTIETNVDANKSGLDLYQGIQTIPLPTAPHIKSVLGTPIYERIKLGVPIFSASGKQTSYSYYTFPDWPMFDISQDWLIKTDYVAGGRGSVGHIGSVKEFISQDDFKITIRGFLINYESEDYPEKAVSDLWAVINAKQSLTITSRVFNLLDIHNIVIQDASFPGLEGYMNVQPFELNCLSDMPILLQIKSVKTQKPI